MCITYSLPQNNKVLAISTQNGWECLYKKLATDLQSVVSFVARLEFCVYRNVTQKRRFPYVTHTHVRCMGAYAHRTVTIFNPLSNTKNFVIETSHRNTDFRTTLIPTYIVWVCTWLYSHYFQSSKQYKQLCHRNVTQKRKFTYITHTHVHCMSVYVHHTVTIFSPLSNTINFAIETLRRNEDLHTFLVHHHTHVHCMCCNGTLTYISKIKPAYSMRLAETRILVYRTSLYVEFFPRSNVKTKSLMKMMKVCFTLETFEKNNNNQNRLKLKWFLK